MNRQIAVIGLGIFGTQVALSLAEKHYSVLAIDSQEDAVAAVEDRVARVVIMDTTQRHALEGAGIREMDTVVVGIGTAHLEASIMTTALLREFGVRNIIARAVSELHERILRQVGATQVINPEREMGEKLAARIARPGFREMMPLSEDICIAEIDAPAEFVGKNLLALNLRRGFNINVLGVQRLQKGAKASAPGTARQERKLLTGLPPEEFVFEADDVVLVMGQQKSIQRLSTL